MKNTLLTNTLEKLTSGKYTFAKYTLKIYFYKLQIRIQTFLVCYLTVVVRRAEEGRRRGDKVVGSGCKKIKIKKKT